MEKNSILIIDDDAININALMHVLESDYTVYAETEAIYCLDVVKKLCPDLILLDVMMPEIDGFKVAEILKENEDTKKIPIIFITGRDSSEDEVRGFSLGAVDYIRRPVSAPVVKARVEHQLRVINNFVKIRQTATLVSNKDP